MHSSAVKYIVAGLLSLLLLGASWLWAGLYQLWLHCALRLKKIEVNKQVEGFYEFYGPNNLKWTGAFKARWGKDRLPCG
jgi:hypothetical protein